MSDELRATSAEEAQAHLQELLAQRGVGGPQNSFMVRTLESSLEILSKQLYDKPTHFLLELIQNADDNRYADNRAPSLCITLRQVEPAWFVQIDCNEVGFDKKQVDAITNVSMSTKTRISNGQKGFIGEKGIGFKSVFNVAGVVEILSGFYDFRIDRSQTLGMLRPQPNRFPVQYRLPRHTQMLLHIKSDKKARLIKRDLRRIRPELLLFLRKLQTLRICLPDGKCYEFVSESKRYEDAFGGETKSITSRIAQDADTTTTEENVTRETGQSIIKGVQTSTTTDHYVVVRFQVKDMPDEEKRQGVRISEVMLAFPSEFPDDGYLKCQKTFAFLPISDFGFKFIIHADFILVANRQNLKHDLSWNSHIRDAIPEAFLDAVNRFNTLSPAASPPNSNSLRYSWPLYLQYESVQNPFWKKLIDKIVDKIRTSRTLESRGGTLRAPGSLKFLPPEFRLSGVVPLVDLDARRSSHLSFSYSRCDRLLTELKNLGVRTMTIAMFCEELEEWADKGGDAGLTARPDDWHEQVANALWKGRNKQKKSLKSLKLVPLQDGTWVNAQTPHVFFPDHHGGALGKGEEGPGDLAFHIVHDRVANNPMWKGLLGSLGISRFDRGKIVSLILEQHKDLILPERSWEMWTRDIVFVFHNQKFLGDYLESSNSGAFDLSRRLRFMTASSDDLELGEAIYVEDPDPGVRCPLLRLLQSDRDSGILMLSDSYLDAVDETERTQFVNWLKNTCGIATHPPLLDNKGSLTEEWMWLAANAGDALLDHVRTHTALQESPAIQGALATLRVTTTALVVPGGHGSGHLKRLLAGTALPTRSLRTNCPDLTFLDLQGPEDKSWAFLSAYGVLRSFNAMAALDQLRRLSSRSAAEVRESQLLHLYRKLDSSGAEFIPKIRDEFARQPMILITSPESLWVRPRDCIRQKPDHLRLCVGLPPSYEPFASLFGQILPVATASIDIVVEEIVRLEPDGDWVQAKSLMSHLNQLVEQAQKEGQGQWQSQEQLDRIRDSLVDAFLFPVRSPFGASLRNVTQGDWWFDDDNDLRVLFSDRAGLVDLEAHQVEALKPLISVLGLDDRRLSRAVLSTASPISLESDERETKLLQQRLPMLCHLSDESALGELDETLSGLSQSKISFAKSLTVTHNLGPHHQVCKQRSNWVQQQEGRGLEVFYIGQLPEIRMWIDDELSEQIINICKITNLNWSRLVPIILQMQPELIPRLLEKHNIKARNTKVYERVQERLRNYLPAHIAEGRVAEDEDMGESEGDDYENYDDGDDDDDDDDGGISTANNRSKKSCQGNSSKGQSDIPPGKLIDRNEDDVDSVYRDTPNRPRIKQEREDDVPNWLRATPNAAEVHQKASRRAVSPAAEQPGAKKQRISSDSSDGGVDSRSGSAEQEIQGEDRRQNEADDHATRNGRGSTDGPGSDEDRVRDLIEALLSRYLPGWSRGEEGKAQYVWDDRCKGDILLQAFLQRFQVEADDHSLSNRAPVVKYHIDVVSTENHWAEPFILTPREWKLAEDNSVKRDGTTTKDVYLLLRPYNMNQENPDYMLFFDPWNLSLQGKLRVQPAGWAVSRGTLGFKKQIC